MIYRNRLQGWLAKQLMGDFLTVDEAFARLGNNDRNVAGTIEMLASVLEREAAITLKLVDEQRLAEANAQVQKARVAFRSLRDKIANLMKAMRDLQNIILDASIASAGG
jgi:hypothetical protein